MWREDKGYDVILVEKGKGFMRLKLCELGCSVFDEKTMEMYAGPALQMQVEGGRGSKKLWCACYLNPKISQKILFLWWLASLNCIL